MVLSFPLGVLAAYPNLLLTVVVFAMVTLGDSIWSDSKEEKLLSSATSTALGIFLS